MSNYVKAAFIIVALAVIGFMIRGIIGVIFLFLAWFISMAVVLHVLQSIDRDMPGTTTEPRSCPHCGSRRYTVYARPDNWRNIGQLWNVLQNRYRYRCNNCGNEWSGRV
ncbi:MAG: hypothetical protein PHY34_03705 [Patescibacteria group bacterium]|nr:hypothetical protein [Patescibacteria group bacterium]MDD5716003.1 hypothetical protein [Patescibacteria group bacterium]